MYTIKKNIEILKDKHFYYATYFIITRYFLQYFVITHRSVAWKKRSICNYKLVSLFTLAHLINCDRILSRIHPKFHKYGNLSSTLMLWGESMPWKSYTSYANFSQVFASFRSTWNTNCCLHRSMYHTETPF